MIYTLINKRYIIIETTLQEPIMGQVKCQQQFCFTVRAVNIMNFIRYISRKISGLPTTESAELIIAKQAIQKNTTTSYDSFFESGYDLVSRPLDLHTYGAISPQLQDEDCISSSKLEKLAEDVYEKFGIS